MSNDPIVKGLLRLAYQFKDSVKFKAFLEAFLKQFKDLQISDNQLLNERYVDTAVGKQLDGIGEIVGLERPFTDIDTAGIFGFKDDPTALGFDDYFNTGIGGNFLDIHAAKVLINDDLYRLLVKAKIIENQTAMIVDDTTRLVSFTFGGVKVRYILTTNLKPRYDIGKYLTPFEANLLKDFPILIGLKEVEYHMYSDTTPFGFDGDPEAYGFGSTSDPNIGGNFSIIV